MIKNGRTVEFLKNRESPSKNGRLEIYSLCFPLVLFRRIEIWTFGFPLRRKVLNNRLLPKCIVGSIRDLFSVHACSSVLEN